jgi:hypothetical protein
VQVTKLYCMMSDLPFPLNKMTTFPPPQELTFHLIRNCSLPNNYLYIVRYAINAYYFVMYIFRRAQIIIYLYNYYFLQEGRSTIQSDIHVYNSNIHYLLILHFSDHI